MTNRQLTIFIVVLSCAFLGFVLYTNLRNKQSANTNNQDNVTIETADTSSGVTTSKSANQHIDKAHQLEQNGLIEDALKEIQIAESLDPKSVVPLLEGGKIYLRQNQPDKAENIFKQALILDPNNTTLDIYLIRSLLAERKVDEAKLAVDELSDTMQITKYYKGILAVFDGDYDNGKKLLQAAADQNTDPDITAKAKNYLGAFNEGDSNKGAGPEVLKTFLARSFNQTGEYQLSIPLLFDAVKANANFRDAWILLGHSYLKIGKYNESIQALETAKKLDPEKPETLFYLGLAYYGMNDLSHAAANLELAKKAGYQPQVQVDQKLAEIYLEMKKYPESASNYERVIALNSSELGYFIKPIWIYIDKLNNPNAALKLAQIAMQTHPNNAMSYNLLGWAQTSANDFADAEKNLNAGRILNPNLDAIYLNLGILKEKQGDLQAAKDNYKKAFTIGHGNSISATAADHYNQIILAQNPNAAKNLKADILNSNK